MISNLIMDKNNHFIYRYIRDELGITEAEAARQIGCTRQAVNQIIHGQRIGPILAVKIWRWSQGRIRLEDMRPDIW